jgi:hypothetical protein
MCFLLYVAKKKEEFRRLNRCCKEKKKSQTLHIRSFFFYYCIIINLLVGKWQKDKMSWLDYESTENIRERERKWCLLDDIKTRMQQEKNENEREKARLTLKNFTFFSWIETREHVVGTTRTSYIFNRYISVCCSCAHTKMVYISGSFNKTKYFRYM